MLIVRNFLLGFFLVCLCGCSALLYVDPLTGANVYNGIAVSCKNPYSLEQDCSIWSGAIRKVDIDGFKFKVSGSKDGKTILVMTRKGCYNFGTVSDHQEMMNALNLLSSLFKKHNIKVTKFDLVASPDNIVGIYICLDKDGYSIIKDYTA